MLSEEEGWLSHPPHQPRVVGSLHFFLGTSYSKMRYEPSQIAGPPTDEGWIALQPQPSHVICMAFFMALVLLLHSALPIGRH